MLCGHGSERFGHIVCSRACVIISQIIQATTTLVKGIQLGDKDANCQVCTPGEERVILCQSLGPQAKLIILRVRKSRKEEGLLTRMTQRTGAKISLPPRRLRTWKLGLTLSILVQMPQSL